MMNQCHVCSCDLTSQEEACYGGRTCENCYIGRRPGTKVDVPRETRMLELRAISRARKLLKSVKATIR